MEQWWGRGKEGRGEERKGKKIGWVGSKTKKPTLHADASRRFPLERRRRKQRSHPLVGPTLIFFSLSARPLVILFFSVRKIKFKKKKREDGRWDFFRRVWSCFG